MSRFSEMGVAGAVAFTIIVFHIMGPIGGLIRFMPTLTQMRISYEHLSKFMEMLDTTVKEQASSGNCAEEFQSIYMEGVRFEYHQEKDGFSVGPLDIEISRGEVVFVTGGNGSGKSTFAHLITGIFRPSEGKFYYNGQEVDTFSSGYRDKLAAIFTDPFLFNYNYEDFRYSEVRTDLENYSAMLKMDNILKINYAKDTIEKTLSKGQQKRLALMLALLEKKQIIVMDEWAAEQDPQFRKYFYRNILPALRAEGKTLILITHDDQYFDCADRILKFEYGNIVEPIESSFEYGKKI
jgi:ABC-type siderophore export system fused ATPase/permease subunit